MKPCSNDTVLFLYELAGDERLPPELRDVAWTLFQREMKQRAELQEVRQR